MLAQDAFTQHYAELLAGSYDAVDRIVLNAYFALGGSGGGMRRWWRDLHGNDSNLTTEALTNMAGVFARRVRGWAKKHNIPVLKCPSGERSHELAEKHIPKDENFRGIFAVVVKRSPAPVWEVLRFKSGGFHLRHRAGKIFVNHFAFQIMDDDWGHVVIRMSGSPPFRAMVILNGHEFVARQARRRGIAFTKEGNCFTSTADPEGLMEIAKRLQSPEAVGILRQVCERWVYSCLCFALTLEEQERSRFRYKFSVFQAEYSRNLLFRNGQQMDQVFNGVIERTRSGINAKTVRTIFGSSKRPYWHEHKADSPVSEQARRFEKVIERPEYDMTVFKANFKRLAAKVYTKGARVLRIEAVAHNTQDLRCGRVLERFADIVSKLSAVLERFMAAMSGIDAAWITDETLEQLPAPSQVGNTRVGGIDANKPRMRAVIAAVVELSATPFGFTTAMLADRVRVILGPGRTYTPRQAAYDLKKLRAKGFVRKKDKQRCYEVTLEGVRILAGLFVLREKVLKPLLTYRGRLKPGRPMPGAVNEAYHTLQRDMQHLFGILNLVA